MLDVLNTGGGGVEALSRHAVAALLNASHPLVGYPMTAEAVIHAYQVAIDSGNAAVIEAQKNLFDAFNNAGCTIDAHGESSAAQGASVLGSTAVPEREQPVIGIGRSVSQDRRPGGLPATGGGELPGGDWAWALTLGSLLLGSIVVVALRNTVFASDGRRR